MSDIDDWTESLAGRREGQERDAELLRKAVREQHEASGPAEDDLRFTALMSRLERENLLPGKAEKRAWFAGWLGLRPALATVLVVALGVGVMLNTRFSPDLVPHVSENFDQAPRFRGGRDPAIDQQRDTAWLIESVQGLMDLNWPYRLDREDDVWRLAFYVPHPTNETGTSWLQSRRLQPAETGWVVVRVQAQP